MECTVVKGLPYVNGKLVILIGSPDVSSHAEESYMRELFPDVEWEWHHSDVPNASVLVPDGAYEQYHHAYDSVLGIIAECELEGGTYDNEDLVPGILTAIAQDDSEIALFCEPDVEDLYPEE